ncbi:MAG TPA: glucose-6-phosphate dehydrogenase assembly protein OpcA [Oceanipulchritudo sp.]|nr:glucose-6-phosphate dehydrogenase assembly protein OpcA [Oceanipulchritudo sp.]
MSRLIDNLPGVAMSVESVTDTLRHMWDSTTPTESNPTDFRASQLNLILHFGLSTTTEEAQEQFNTAIRFAQKYPCRIVVLCPSEKMDSTNAFEGKLFSQCYLGKHLRDLCCCEALILGYSPEQSDYLENQVSVWLESDLPVYLWFHRVPAERISKYYLEFLKRCRRILFDGEVEGDAYDRIAWPEPDRVRDLAYARTLPLRQHLGQFISGFSREELVDGLQSLVFQYTRGLRRKALQLLRWHRTALEKCFPKPADIDSVVFTSEQLVQEHSDSCLRMEWQYNDKKKYLVWEYNRSRKSGLIRASFPSGSFEHPLHIEPLKPETSLSEAMFFN